MIGAEVLFYGHGEGTWPFGKPGFLFALRVEEAGGRVTEVVSDGSWRALLDRAHRPGQFKRWYLRALQEDFDARLRPAGWSEPGFAPDAAWMAPQVLEVAADRPAAAGSHYDYLTDGGIDPAGSELRAREVPLVRETFRSVGRLARSGRVRWLRDPRDWFEYRIPGSFEIVDQTAATPSGEGSWLLEPPAGEGAFATFELPEQMVGFPFLTVEAPAGTVVEVMTQESHDPAGPAWLDTHRFSWTRFVCREGENRFESFDYESLRFLQVHVHEASGPVVLRDVGVRRRSYPWPKAPSFACPEPKLQRVFEASFNTLVNAAQETIVDGMGRERQQYSGDGAHLLHATRLVCGDRQLARRFLRTFPMGQTPDGFFLDCWPAFDRLNRLAQRQVGATPWGPLLDHGVTLVYDAWRHHRETGETDLLLDLYPRFVRFADYLLARRGKDGLLPVEGWGVPAVWIDNCFPRPRHKQCAFNLFTAAILKAALAPIAAIAGDPAGQKRWAAAVGRAPRGDGAPLLERRARPLRGQPPLGGRGGRRAARTTARSRRRSSSTSAPAGRTRRGASPRSPRRPTRWASPTRPTRTGGCRPWPATAGSTRSCASCASAGRCCPRSSSTTRPPRTGRCAPTRPTSGATARWGRCSSSTWRSPASSPPSPASRRWRSGPSSATWPDSSSPPTRRAGRSSSAPRPRRRATGPG